VALVPVLAVLQRADLEGQPTWLAIGLTTMVAFALPWRRSYPLAVAVAYVGAFILVDIVNLGDELHGMVLAGVLFTYALLRWGSARESAIGFALLFVMYAVHNMTYAGFGVYDGLIATGFWLLPAVIGGTMRYRAENRRRLIDDARLNERVQLARELHDTVAHHVSAIAIQAQAARVVATSKPDAANEALRVIELTASRALLEMRKVVGALRTAEVDMAPQQRLSDIKRLANQSQGGPRVKVEFTGPLDTLEPWEEVGLYRVAQESITNALRHARNASRISVRVYCTGETVCLTVEDDGENDLREPRGSDGHGLVGMEERMNLLGGQFEAGPNPDGGWFVRATLPRTGGS
jgi:signal transduction histidine kinase